MATYYALTTENAQALGWRVVAMGEHRRAVFEEALAALGNPAQDLYAQTEHRNLRVLSQTQAKRELGTAGFAAAVERFCEED